MCCEACGHKDCYGKCLVCTSDYIEDSPPSPTDACYNHKTSMNNRNTETFPFLLMKREGKKDKQQHCGEQPPT